MRGQHLDNALAEPGRQIEGGDAGDLGQGQQQGQQGQREASRRAGKT